MKKKDEQFGEEIASAQFPSKRITIRQYEKGFIIKNTKENTETRRERPQGTDAETMAQIIGEVMLI